MVLNNEQIRELLEIIRLHHHAFVYNNVTKELDPEIIVQLQNRNLISKEATSYLKDAYEMERLRSVLEEARNRNLTYEQMKRYLFTNPIPLTDTEVASINHVQQSAGQYVTKQGDLLKHGFEEMVRNQNIEYKQDVISNTIKTPLQAGIERRKTISEIVSDMRSASDDQFRDWHRVAQTELQNARNHAKIDQIYSVNKDKPEEEILVYKRPNPDACKACKSVYLEADGVTPKVFRMSEFKKNITNFGLKTKKWMPCVETLHPWCQCEMATLPPGFGFDKKGQVKFVGKSKMPKPKKPDPAEVNWNLYDSQGNLKKSQVIEKIKKSKHRCDLIKALSKTGRKKFTVQELVKTLNDMEKGRKGYPIGTVRHGRKKMPNGTWVPVKEGQQQPFNEEKKQTSSADLEQEREKTRQQAIEAFKQMEKKKELESPKISYSVDELSQSTIEGRDGKKYRVKATGKPSTVEYKSPRETKTNLVGHVAFGKVKKEQQIFLNQQLQSCEIILEEMGVRFKTPVDFVCQGMNKTTGASASFYPLQNYAEIRNRIEIARNQSIEKSLIHEIGHAMDFAFGEGNYLSEELQLSKDDRVTLKESFQKLEEIAKNSPEYKRADKKRYQYLTDKTEMFARGFEVYGYHIAQKLIDQGKIDESFLALYTPDYIRGTEKVKADIKESNPEGYKEYEAIKKEFDSASKDLNEAIDNRMKDPTDQLLREKYLAAKKKYKSIERKRKKKWREIHQNVFNQYVDRHDKDQIIQEVVDIMDKLISGSEFKRAQDGYENNLKKSKKSSGK